MNPSVTDRELVAAVVTGDAEAAALFVERFFRFIVVIAARFARTPSSLLHNVPQNVIERLWKDDFKRLRMWRGEGDFAPYLAKIVKSMAMDYVKTPWHRHVVASGLPGEGDEGAGPFGHPDDGPDAHQTFLAEERRLLLAAAMKKLGARDRDVLERRWIHEESVAQISAELGLKENAVHQALHRAMGNLRALLREMDPAQFGETLEGFGRDPSQQPG